MRTRRAKTRSIGAVGGATGSSTPHEPTMLAASAISDGDEGMEEVPA